MLSTSTSCPPQPLGQSLSGTPLRWSGNANRLPCTSPLLKTSQRLRGSLALYLRPFSYRCRSKFVRPPERGCPGRTYTLDRYCRRQNEFGGLKTLFGEDLTDSLIPPPLIQDTSSSSSDESSDGLAPLPSHFNSPESKHRRRGVRRQHKQSSTPLDHDQYSRPSFSDSSLRSNLLADEGIFGGF